MYWGGRYPDEAELLQREAAVSRVCIREFEALPKDQQEEARAQWEARAAVKTASIALWTADGILRQARAEVKRRADEARREKSKAEFLARWEREEAERRAATKARNALAAERRAARLRLAPELPKLRPDAVAREVVPASPPIVARKPRIADSDPVEITFPAPLVEADANEHDDTPAWLIDEIDSLARRCESESPWQRRQKAQRSRRYEGCEIRRPGHW
jgi:hypothetical protein